MTITRGPVKSAIRVAVYGTEGVGKSTFASQFPGAVFIDTEGSTTHMDGRDRHDGLDGEAAVQGGV